MKATVEKRGFAATLPVWAFAACLMMLCSFTPPASASQDAFVPVGTTWPVLHGTPENTDFVPLAGPRELLPKWKALQVRADTAVVAVGPEGNLYTMTMDEGPCHLHALDKEGNVLWCSDQLRTAFSVPVVNDEGSIFVTDGTEVFRFEPDGTITWRVPATAASLGGVFLEGGYVLFLDALGFGTAYHPATGGVVAQLAIPSGVIPRPSPLPANLAPFVAGGPLIGIDPDFLLTFMDAFWDWNTAIGNNIPAVHPETGRIFIAVTADETGTQGVFYGIDFHPPVDAAPGALEIGCSASLGLASGTSPAISEDGERVYVGDSSGVLNAFDVDDCSVAWSLPLEEPSLASPTVGLDGKFFMLVAKKVTAFRDNVDSGEQLWQTDLTPLAKSLGLAAGQFNSVIPLSANYLYGAASLFGLAGTSAIPVSHGLVTLDPETGQILSIADLGEESDSTVSLGPDGMIYVPSKPIVKGVLLGTPLKPFLSPPQSGVFAFEPVSYEELTADGMRTAIDFIERGRDVVEEGGHPEPEVSRALRQLSAANENLTRAGDRDEVSRRTSRRVHLNLKAASLALQLSLCLPPSDLILWLTASSLEWGVGLLDGVPAARGSLVEDATLQHEGIDRYFDYYVPADLPDEEVPLLFVLHGGTQSNDAAKIGPTAEFRDLADREKLLIILPNGTDSATGTSGPSGNFNWNDCRSDAGDAASTADDVGFISALIDWAEANYNIDPDRVYATGASNGGMMSYRLALELSERIAAVGAQIANQPANSECPSQPADPVSVLIMNGTADTVYMPYEGGQIVQNRGLVLSAEETRDLWRGILGTDPTPQHVEFPDIDSEDGGTVTLDLYSGGADGSEVAFYKVEGGGHTPPSIQHPLGDFFESLLGPQNHDIESAEQIWNFLKQHSR
jgi:polyhydroxybutyrate depolymerase